MSDEQRLNLLDYKKVAYLTELSRLRRNGTAITLLGLAGLDGRDEDGTPGPGAQK